MREEITGFYCLTDILGSLCIKEDVGVDEISSFPP